MHLLALAAYASVVTAVLWFATAFQHRCHALDDASKRDADGDGSANPVHFGGVE